MRKLTDLWWETAQRLADEFVDDLEAGAQLWGKTVRLRRELGRRGHKSKRRRLRGHRSKRWRRWRRRRRLQREFGEVDGEKSRARVLERRRERERERRGGVGPGRGWDWERGWGFTIFPLHKTKRVVRMSFTRMVPRVSVTNGNIIKVTTW